jgi:hypothetical protein
MICRHLCEGRKLGYYRVQVSPDSDDYETGLCKRCDALLWKENGWTDRLFDFAGWKLYCRKCYEKVLTGHRLLGVGTLGSEEE